jgi:hypothetical protein
VLVTGLSAPVAGSWTANSLVDRAVQTVPADNPVAAHQGMPVVDEVDCTAYV